MIDLFKKYAHKAQDALDETKDKSQASDEDEKVQQAGKDLKAFVEKLSGKSLDDVITAGQKVRGLGLSSSCDRCKVDGD